MSRTDEFIREMRALAGLQNAILRGITVTKKDQSVTFSIVTDKAYTREEEERVKKTAEKYLPAGFVARTDIIKRVPDEEMLRNGPYPYYLKQRIAANTGHLSNRKAAQLCCILARAGVKKIMLGHISPENNLPELALKSCCKELLEKGYDDIDITVADRYVPTRF